MIKVEKAPSAVAIDKKLKKAPAALAAKKADIALEAAEAIAKDAINSILKQTAGFAPISASTARQKLDSRILIDTGKYVESISSEKVGDHAVVQGDAVGMFHENGTSKMPARPHIGPAIARAKVPPSIKKIIDSIFED